MSLIATGRLEDKISKEQKYLPRRQEATVTKATEVGKTIDMAAGVALIAGMLLCRRCWDWSPSQN